MSMIDFFLGSNPDLKIQFDEDEEGNLALHVRQEARRFRDLFSEMRTIRALLVSIIVLLLMNNTIDIKAAVSHFMGW